jgi:hypothetical protein
VPSLSLNIVSRPAARSVWLVMGGLVGAAALAALLLFGQGRLALTLMATGLLFAVAAVDMRVAIAVAFVLLIVLGDLRRLLIPYFGWSGADPLLLVGSGFAVVVTGHALAVGALRFDTNTAKIALALIAVMVLQIFNPRQGGLMVGLAGTLFMLTPLLWFWVGRTYATPALLRTLLFKVVLPAAGVAAVYGTFQVFHGYLPHQQRWLEMNWYAGLGDPSNPSPISLFASNTEYARFLSIGVVVAWAGVLHERRPALLAVVLALLAAIALTGIRGPLLFSLVMMAGLWAVLGRSKKAWMVRGAVALGLAAVALAGSLSQAKQLGMGTRAGGRLERQAQQFVPSAAAESEGRNSAANHFFMMLNGYTFAWKEPLGKGLGSVTKAASRFGGKGFSTETPFGDSFVALGLPGGVLYHVFVALVVAGVFRFWQRTRGLLALALMGVLGVTMANLLAGGMYAVGPLVAFCAGAVDHPTRRS